MCSSTYRYPLPFRFVALLILPYFTLVSINTEEVRVASEAIGMAHDGCDSVLAFFDDIGPDADSDSQKDHNDSASLGGDLAPHLINETVILPQLHQIGRLLHHYPQQYPASHSADVPWLPPEWNV